ncbi:MAG: hypothetical protein ACC633_03865 [Anaerolineales bacterium]
MKKLGFISIAFAASLFLASCAQAAAPSTEAPPAASIEVKETESTTTDEPTQAVDVQPDLEEIQFSPGLVVGGVRRVEASSVGEDVRWILPGLRTLDPAIFGTPDQPLGFEPDTGLPLEARLVSEDGTAYTTTAGPTPFSDNFALIEGSFNLSVVDATLVDGPDSQDQVDFNASFTGPDGKEYAIKLLKVIPKGPEHPFFGGVATNIIQHGATGIGTSLMPGAYTYVAFWGVAELSIDGEVVASNRIIHGMITSDPRDEEYKLGFDQDIDNSKVVFHLILPNTEVTPDGPQDSPVPTGFLLPNGAEQPFFHIMFEGFQVSPALVVSQ